MAQMALAVSESAEASAYHYFSAHACVFVDGNRRSVFVGGSLVSSYEISDKATRNAILVKLSEDPKVHLGKLGEAFELGREQVHTLQKKYAAGGLLAVMEIKQGGLARVVTPALRRELYQLFDAGASINLAHTKIKFRISWTMVGRTRKAWRLEREPEASARATAKQTDESAAPDAKQLEFGAETTRKMAPELATISTFDMALRAAGALGVATLNEISAPPSDAGLVCGPSLHGSKEASCELIIDAKKQYVQHAGAFIVLALLQAFGLYRHAEALRKSAIADGNVDRRYSVKPRYVSHSTPRLSLW